MAHIDVSVGGPVSSTIRARQLESLFDVPRATEQHLRWAFDAPYDDGRPWNIGVLVGPSGCGKSTILRAQFGEPRALDWTAPSVVDAFDASMSMPDIAAACQAVGFNTIPAWLRPYDVLSNGERFRVDMARLLIDAQRDDTMVVVDEFTSVVDRQVAKIGAHAVAKYARRHDLRVVLATCHYDVLDWLSPDWVIEPAERRFSWRSVQPRPSLDVELSPVDHSAWKLFAPYHYLTNQLHRAARCYVAFVNGEPAAFAGLMYRPHARANNIWGVSRLVTLPDWQGLGLAFVLVDNVAAAYKAHAQRVNTYPAHPSLVRSFDRSRSWELKTKPGFNIPARGKSSTVQSWKPGSRPCAVFSYAGPMMNADDARRLLSRTHPNLRTL